MKIKNNTLFLGSPVDHHAVSGCQPKLSELSLSLSPAGIYRHLHKTILFFFLLNAASSLSVG